MPPKKAALDNNASTSPASDVSEKADSDSVSASKVAAHPPTMVMVKDAVKELDSRKGVSSQAIRNSIKQKYPTIDLVRLKYTVRNALIKGLENGSLVRPANSTATGAQGRFRLAPQKATEPKQKTEKTDPDVGKKATKAGPKKGNGADKGSGTRKKMDSKKKSATPETVKTKTDEVTASKVAPAKKPKAKRVAINMEAPEEFPDDGAPKAKAPKVKAPKVKAPKAEEPKVKAPKVKAPKAEAPKVKAPKAEAPKAEAPKVKAPKVKAPKATKGKVSIKDD